MFSDKKNANETIKNLRRQNYVEKLDPINEEENALKAKNKEYIANSNLKTKGQKKKGKKKNELTKNRLQLKNKFYKSDFNGDDLLLYHNREEVLDYLHR